MSPYSTNLKPLLWPRISFGRSISTAAPCKITIFCLLSVAQLTFDILLLRVCLCRSRCRCCFQLRSSPEQGVTHARVCSSSCCCNSEMHLRRCSYIFKTACTCPPACALTMPYVPNVRQLARFLEKLDVLQLRELHGLLHLGVPWVT